MLTTIAGRKYRLIDLGYRPREPFVAFHRRRQRWACLVAHRRAGKTVACVADLNDYALRCTKRDGRYAYVAPYYVQAKDAAWTYLKRFAMLVPGARINESELRVDYSNGARIRLYGADNYDRMRGQYFDGVILDEYGDMHPAAWPEVIRPMLADRRGWGVFIGTPKGRNDFFKVWERARAAQGEWFSMMLKASGSGLLDEEEIEAIRAELTPEQFAQEMECSFDAAILGAYYGKEIVEAEQRGRIGVAPVDPALPVHTSWDLGIGDSTAIWCWQIAPDGIRVVDFYESHSQPLSHYVGVLAAKGYRGKVWVPHDAKARELGTGRTRVETLMSLGRDVQLVPNHSVMDGINSARVLFSRMHFNESTCRHGIEALRQYRADYDEKLKVFRNVPRHDWTSHAADAFRYLAMSWRALKPAPPPARPTHHVLEIGSGGEIKSNMSVRELIELRRKKKLERLNG